MNIPQETIQMINDLSPHETAILYEMVDNPYRAQEIYEADYEHIPVDIETFLRDPYFLGDAGGNDMPEIFIKDLNELFEGDYYEAILTGSLGAGKGTFAEFAMLYMIYRTACYRNPQRMYGLFPGSSIYFINLAINATQARRVLFNNIRSKLLLSPFFQNDFPFDPNITTELRFEKNIYVVPGSSLEASFVGLNALGGAVDEINLFPVVEKSVYSIAGRPYHQGTKVYNSFARRQKSRFIKQGKLPGILIGIGSSRYPEDFTEMKEKEAEDNPHIFFRRYSLWDTKPADTFVPWTFRVEVSENPRMLKAYEAPAAGLEVIDVPGDFLTDFQKDIVGALQELAGKPVRALKRFIRNAEAIYECIKRDQTAHLYSEETTDLESGHLVRARMIGYDKKGLKIPGPRIHRRAKRYAHIDLSLTRDSCGIVIAHQHSSKHIQRTNIETGEKLVDEYPVIYIDLALEIYPPASGEIIIGNVRGIIYQFIECGYWFERISLDGFQSADSLQIFRSKGVKADLFSVDASREPYEKLKDAYYEERVNMYHYPPLIGNLLALEDLGKKIDHRPGGKKDVSDCLAAVISHIEEDFRKAAPPPPPSQGFLIGQEEARVRVEEKYDWLK